MSQEIFSLDGFVPQPKLPHEQTPYEREQAELTRQREAFQKLPEKLQGALRIVGQKLPLLQHAAQGFPTSNEIQEHTTAPVTNSPLRRLPQ